MNALPVISHRGLAFLAREEALVTVGFLDDGTPAIGYSHHGLGIVPGVVWTQEQALAQMITDCEVCATVLSRAINQPVMQTCWDALISLAYNLGPGTVSRSPLAVALAKGDLAMASDLFVNSGWRNPARRQREQTLFWHGDYTSELDGLRLGQMLLYTSDPHASPKPVPQIVPFPLQLEA